MLFFIHHEDRADGWELRKATRASHLEYMSQFQVLAGGPTLNDESDEMNGSVIILDFPDRAACERFVAEDPYTKAGLFQKTTIKRWKKIVLQDIELEEK